MHKRWPPPSMSSPAWAVRMQSARRTSAADGDAIAAVYAEVFGDVRLASTMVVVIGFLDPRWKLEIEAEALVSQPRQSVMRTSSA
jgi:hypothetical protein